MSPLISDVVSAPQAAHQPHRTPRSEARLLGMAPTVASVARLPPPIHTNIASHPCYVTGEAMRGNTMVQHNFGWVRVFPDLARTPSPCRASPSTHPRLTAPRPCG